LQDAKARFSELVRRVRSKGPQHVTIHGREEVVVISAEEFRRLKGDLTGQALIAAMQASPDRDIDLSPERGPLPVRDVSRGVVIQHCQVECPHGLAPREKHP
jgi:prevent-host-death family protein